MQIWRVETDFIAEKNFNVGFFEFNFAVFDYIAKIRGGFCAVAGAFVDFDKVNIFLQVLYKFCGEAGIFGYFKKNKQGILLVLAHKFGKFFNDALIASGVISVFILWAAQFDNNCVSGWLIKNAVQVTFAVAMLGYFRN